METSFTVLGHPVSMNSAYPTGHYGSKRRFLSREAQDWKTAVATGAMLARGQVTQSDNDFTARIDCKMKFYFSDHRIRDPHNYIKLILDAMTGIFYKDDSQVKSGSWDEGFGEPRVEIWIRTVD